MIDQPRLVWALLETSDGRPDGTVKEQGAVPEVLIRETEEERKGERRVGGGGR